MEASAKVVGGKVPVYVTPGVSCVICGRAACAGLEIAINPSRITQQPQLFMIVGESLLVKEMPGQGVG